MKKMGISLKCLCVLAGRLYRENKRRNIAIFIAIALASMFIMVVFTVTDSMQKMISTQNLKVIGTVAEGMYHNITSNQYEIIHQDPKFSEVSYNVFLGTIDLDTKELAGIRVLYSEEKAAKWSFNDLIEGHWAEQPDEIVVDEMFLSCFDRIYQLGDKLLLKIVANGEVIEREFTICGICNSNKALGISNLYVSKRYLEEEYYKIFPENVSKEMGFVTGLITMYSRFEFSNDAAEILQNVWKQYYPEEEADVWINPVYGKETTSFASFIAIGLIIGIIILCAYLTIYTIYYISTTRDVQFYGQLKLIGMSNRQISLLVWMQAMRQYMIATPIGLFLGCGIGYVVLPIILSLISNSEAIVYQIKPKYFLYSACIALFTVLIGVNKPAKMLTKIEPIHTVGFTGISKIKKYERKTSRVTLTRLALRNVQRNKFRALLVSTSVCAVLVLFMCTANMINSISLEGYMSIRQLPADLVMGTKEFVMYQLADASEDRGIPLDGSIDNTVLEDIKEKCPDAQIEPYYYTYYPHLNNSVTTERFKKLYEEGKVDVEHQFIDIYKRHIENPKSSKYWCCEQRYYVEYESLEKCKVLEGTLDRERFESGKYVVMIACPDIADGGTLYHVGEKVDLSEWVDGVSFKVLDNGEVEWSGEEKKEYEVMAVVDEVPLVCAYLEVPLVMFFSVDQIPEGEESPRLFAITIETEDVDSTESIISDYVSNREGEVDYISYRVIKKELAGASNFIRLVGGGLAFVVAIMAVVNFINNCMTTMIERKEEFATLRAIGMTKKQLVHMLRIENAFIVGGASVAGLIIGMIIASIGLEVLCKEVFWLSYNPTVIPGILLSLLLVFIATRYPGKRSVS